MASGVAMATSNSILPSFTCAARSSSPTSSAPAAFAALAGSPCVNTATRTDLPVPCGSTSEPRTTWSDFLASTPRFTATSIDSLNFAVAFCLTSLIASSTGYGLLRSTAFFNACRRLEIFAISDALHFDTHAARTASHGAYGRIQIRCGQIGHFGFRDLLGLSPCQPAHLINVRFGAALVESDRLANQH